MNVSFDYNRLNDFECDNYYDNGIKSRNKLFLLSCKRYSSATISNYYSSITDIIKSTSHVVVVEPWWSCRSHRSKSLTDSGETSDAYANLWLFMEHVRRPTGSDDVFCGDINASSNTSTECVANENSFTRSALATEPSRSKLWCISIWYLLLLWQ